VCVCVCVCVFGGKILHHDNKKKSSIKATN
jgi:hypothetical protein